MPEKATETQARRVLTRAAVPALIALAFVLTSSTPVSRSTVLSDTPIGAQTISPVAFAEVNFSDLAASVKALPNDGAPPRALLLDELDDSFENGGGQGAVMTTPQTTAQTSDGRPHLLLSSPAPTQNYAGLDDIAMVDSNYIIIPPDVAGGVGPTKVMESFNNNYRIRDKATGLTQLTVGTATFWSAVANGADRNHLTDPRTTYDPYNNRWIVAMQTTLANGAILVGVSQTSDPAGAWFLYKFAGFPLPVGATGYLIDFPILGFNKNWVTVTINQFNQAGSFTNGLALVLNYPLLRTGTGSGSVFQLNGGAATTHFCTSPAVTYSPSEDTLFCVIHFSSGGASYIVDAISGTPAAPVYTASGTLNTRPGGGWTQPSGNIEPQSIPVSGASACGATPCKIEASDAQVRAAPIYRNGLLWYAQTIGLPAGVLARTSAQWTCVTPGLVPAFVDGGRVDDPTATATNGGKWYDHVSLSVNANNDVMVGYTQFSSAQHPSTGYSFRFGTDAPGTIRDPFIYRTGDDYYHKTFTTTTGRNRWGDFTTTQVDPCNDLTLWTLQEYAKGRTGTDDGNTGSNSSRWASWWAAVAGSGPVAQVTCPGNTIGSPGGSVPLNFRVTNSGTAAGTFDYSITDVAGWGGPAVGTTPSIAAGGFVDIPVTFNIPSNCTPPSDLVTFSAKVTGAAGCFASVQCQMTISCDLATAALYSRFDVAPVASGVDITWSSDAIGDVQSWNVYRATTLSSGWTRVNANPIPMGAGGSFTVHDEPGTTGSRYYRLSAVLKNGNETALSNTQVTLGSATYSFALAGSNPFTNRVTLRYTLPKTEHVSIDVYTVAGQRVQTLVNRTDAPGAHSVDFAMRDGSRALTPGVYMVKITAGSYSHTLRVVGIE